MNGIRRTAFVWAGSVLGDTCAGAFEIVSELVFLAFSESSAVLATRFGGGPRTAEMSEMSFSKSGEGCVGSQFMRSAAWTAPNPNGGFISSSRIGIRIFRSRPQSASSCTHLDLTDSLDQTTTTARAFSRASPITSRQVFPAGMVRSHQTDHPYAARAFMSIATLERSSLA